MAAIIILLHRRENRHRRIKYFAQDHTAGKEWIFIQFSVAENFSKLDFLSQMDSIPRVGKSFPTISYPSPYIRSYRYPTQQRLLIKDGLWSHVSSVQGLALSLGSLLVSWDSHSLIHKMKT